MEIADNKSRGKAAWRSARRSSRGMTLVEVLSAIAIMVAVMGAVYAFEADVMKNQANFSGNMNDIQSVQTLLKKMDKNMRGMAYGDSGQYPISSAGTSSLTFYSDIDGDGHAEQVAYSLAGGALQETVTGRTLNSTSTIATGLSNDQATPLFQYFNSNYTGVNGNSQTASSLNDIRGIKTTLALKSRTYSSFVAIRILEN